MKRLIAIVAALGCFALPHLAHAQATFSTCSFTDSQHCYGVGPGAAGQAYVSNGSSAYPAFSSSLPGVTSVNGTNIPANGTLLSIPTLVNGDVLSNDGTNLVWINGGGGSMTWPAAAGIPCYSGSSSWCTSYSTGNTIPADYIAAIPITQISGLGTGVSTWLQNPTLGNLNTALGVTLPAISGSITTGDCAEWASGTTLQDAGVPCGSGSMVYPGAGIALSTGSAWGTSITTLAGLNTELGVTIPSVSGSITTGDCAKWASATTLADAGAACGSGGSGTVSDGSGTTTPNEMAVSTSTAHTITYTAIPASANCVGTNSSSQFTAGCPEPLGNGGAVITATTYTVASGDCGALDVFNGTASQTITVPAASSLSNCQVDFQTYSGASTATLTPASGTIGGFSTIAMAAGSTCTLNSNGTTWYLIGCPASVSSGGGGTSEDVQVFTASGTWTKPSGSPKTTEVMCLGAGGGGGSGAVEPSGTAGQGGAGGGGGSWARQVFPTSSLASTETVTIGAAGTGGTAVAATGTGSNGSNGGNATFGSLVTGYGGGAGFGGLSGSSVNGGGGASLLAAGTNGSNKGFCAGSAQGTTGSASCGSGGAAGANTGATAGSGNGGGSALYGGAGGGSGGDISTTPGAFAGGAGGVTANNQTVAGGGATGSAGTAGTAGSSSYMSGNSGGGGGSSTTGNGGAGGVGGLGSGGGGGGAALNGTGSSGAGGNGGGGECLAVTTY